MSRTVRKHKDPTYEYWSRRPFATKVGGAPGRITKIMTHRQERRVINKREIDFALRNS